MIARKCPYSTSPCPQPGLGYARDHPMKSMLPALQVLLSVVTVTAITFDSSDVQIFTVNRCTDIVEKANTSGHVTEENSISACRKHYQSKETCGLLSEMLSLALMRNDFNRSSFCEMMTSAHGCSSAMDRASDGHAVPWWTRCIGLDCLGGRLTPQEDFLSSDVVADLAFGHCRRLRSTTSTSAAAAPAPPAPPVPPDAQRFGGAVRGVG
eukprot:Skav231596  [mRNA]  locus=scaffold232:302127:310904:+ [translate_table: standard]